jgi:hypothetical protein
MIVTNFNRRNLMRRIIPIFVIGLVLLAPRLTWAAPQPHMEAALAALENALHEIEIADQARDHGGHAGAATNLIRDAIREVHEGIRFRDAHGP